MNTRAGEIQLITFKLGENVYAVDVKHVKEVVSLKKLVKIPRMPMHVEGVMNLRGKIITLINLASFLGVDSTVEMQEGEHSKRKILIFSLSSGKDAGFIVDNVLGVLRVKKTDIEKVVSSTDPAIEGVIKAEGEHILIVLNFPSLISELNLNNLDSTEGESHE